jgi:transcriptional regulatory protein RtcR
LFLSSGRFVGSSEGGPAMNWVQLERVVATCTRCRSLSEAGRLLFHNSRSRKSSPNEPIVCAKYLTIFGLDWNVIAGKRGRG